MDVETFSHVHDVNKCVESDIEQMSGRVALAKGNSCSSSTLVRRNELSRFNNDEKCLLKTGIAEY